MSRGWSAMLFVAALGAGCGDTSLPPAGSYSEVVVFVDGDRAQEWAGLLTASLTRERDYFVSTESPFRVTVGDPGRIGGAEAEKNVVLCAVLGGSTAVGTRIERLLGRAESERVRRGAAAIVSRADTPAAGRLTVIVTAATADELRDVLRRRGAEIPEMIDASARERLRRSLLAQRRQVLSDSLYRWWGFRLEIPAAYSLASESDSPPGVELVRDGPPRVLGVFWREWNHAPSIEDRDDLFAWRADYVRRRYDGDEMDPARVRTAPGRLGAYPALCQSGYWHNDRVQPAGGYFETYWIWDRASQRLWAVDLVVYAPGREKTTLLRELRAVAETFRTE